MAESEIPASPPAPPPKRSLIAQLVSAAVTRVQEDPKRTTLALFTLLIAKVLLVTRGDLLTSLALIHDAGLVPVTIGVVMSMIPIAAALAMAFALYGRTCCQWKWDEPLRQAAVITVVVLVSAWFSPWYLFLPALVLSVLLGAYDREEDERRPAVRSKAGLGFLILAVTGVVYALAATLFTMWLPHEQLDIKGSSKPRIGYVVGESGGYLNVLTSHDRRVARIPSGTVESRTLCRGSDFHESLIQWTARRLGHPLEYLGRCGSPELAPGAHASAS